MHYLSTRGATEPHSFADVLLGGLAPDGGLFMPEFWPRIPEREIEGYAQASYQDVAFRIMERFAGAAMSRADLKADIAAAYSVFDAPEIAPLVEIEPDLYVLELFHGPTLAFKDIAMRLLGQLFSRALRTQKRHATILVATSGDTGSAAIAALGGLPNVTVFVLYPHGRVSEVQRRQMTTNEFENVHTIALEGSFDDAQSIVKALFSDRAFANRAGLVAVNSINFVRIAAQSVYYFIAAAKLGRPPVFVVPTGNFGDVFAGEAAMRMGLGVEELIVATNANDIMVRAINEGIYKAGSAQATLSPSMDIQVASNFERAIFEASGRDSVWLSSAMAEFSRSRRLTLPEHVVVALGTRYSAVAVDDQQTLSTISHTLGSTGYLADPHTAVALAAARKVTWVRDAPKVVLSTAHPAKFPEAVAKATGGAAPLPQRLKDLYDKPEHYSVLPNGEVVIRAYIEARLSGS